METTEILLGAAVSESPDNNAIVTGNNPPTEPQGPTGLVGPDGEAVSSTPPQIPPPETMVRKLQGLLGHLPRRDRIICAQAITVIGILTHLVQEAREVAVEQHRLRLAAERELAAGQPKTPKTPDVTITRLPAEDIEA
jgi:hypothetical protein